MTDNVVHFLPPPHVPRIVKDNPAPIIFLPVVRIENHPEPVTGRRRPRTLREMSRNICGND